MCSAPDTSTRGSCWARSGTEGRSGPRCPAPPPRRVRVETGRRQGTSPPASTRRREPIAAEARHGEGLTDLRAAVIERRRLAAWTRSIHNQPGERESRARRLRPPISPGRPAGRTSSCARGRTQHKAVAAGEARSRPQAGGVGRCGPRSSLDREERPCATP